MTEGEFFNSPVFGYIKHATKEERELVCKLVNEIPVAVFQELNKILNEQGRCIHIDFIPK